MIELPPKISQKDLLKYVKEINKNTDIQKVIEKINDNYEYWSEVKYKKLPEGVKTPIELWGRVKLSRYLKTISVWDKYGINTAITNYMQRMCHDFDMNFGGSWGTSHIIGNENKEQFLISSLMEEAISSSKMEGASTTRKLAKEMLRKKISPKDKFQQMIFNNYNTIKFIVDNKNQPLSEELLRKIHSMMTKNTLSRAEDAGKFRADNEVVVENAITRETVHVPPPHNDIATFVQDLICFFNEKDSDSFIHPIIKGIIIHFMIGYMHPFTDGNGRTARALFYWYMLKEGYWLTEYLSISRIIAKSKNNYEKAYLYTENDGNDMGYFITYNLTVLDKAFKELKNYIKRKLNEKKDAIPFLKLGDFNERQARIIKFFVENPGEMLTVKDVEVKYGIVPATAKRDIVGLLEHGLLSEISLNKVKKGYLKSDDFDRMISKK